MNNHTLYENTPTNLLTTRFTTPIDRRVLLSTIWTSVLFADVLRGVHETLRPGFVEELATKGTVYGNEVTNTTLVVSGVALSYLCAVVVLSRVLPRRSNRRVNTVGAVFMIGGVLGLWPKDADDYVFGAVQILGAALVLAICHRWTDDQDIDRVDDRRRLAGLIP